MADQADTLELPFSPNVDASFVVYIVPQDTLTFDFTPIFDTAFSVVSGGGGGAGGGGGFTRPGFRRSVVMNPTSFMLDALANAVASNNVTLGSAGNISLCLLKNAFTPGANVTIPGIGEADFGGYSRLTINANATVQYDPADGSRILHMTIPAGGYRYTVGSNVSLPQNIYGVGLLVNNGNQTLGTAKVDNPGSPGNPITLNSIGQFVDIDPETVDFRVNGNALT